MNEVLILYIIISYPIVLGYTIAFVIDEELSWSNSKHKLFMVFVVLFSPAILLVLLGSLLFAMIKD